MKISLVVPVYNLEKYVPVLLNSLKAQTDKTFEAILIDDGSTDGSLEVMQKMTADMSADSTIISVENGGVSAARNLGLSKATGDYVLFLDGDDFIADTCIETVRKADPECRSDIICWAFNEVNEDHSVRRHYYDMYRSGLGRMSGKEALSHLIHDKDMWISVGGAAYRREFLEKEEIFFEENCRNGEDQEFTLKALGRAKEVLFIDQVQQYYVRRRGSVTNTYNVRRFDIIEALERAYRFIDPAPSAEWAAKFRAYTILQFFSNLNGCIQNAGIRRTKEILEEMERHYPGLLDRIMADMKAYAGPDANLAKRIRLFLESPYFYAYYMKHRGNAVIARRGFL